MEKLPFVILKELFQMMDNLNAVIRCSHVCKNWRTAYQTMVGPETVCLYFQKYIPLNHRLFYTNDRVFPFQFLRLKRPAPPHELQFFDFETIRTHFANLKKLVILNSLGCRDDEDSCNKIVFLNQLNSFKLLEYVEIHGKIRILEGSEIEIEIDLPNLRVLGLDTIVCETPESAQALQTLLVKAASLEAIRMTLSSGQSGFRSNLKLAFPPQLKHLNIECYKIDFKFHTELPNLESLIFKCHKNYEELDEDYLEPVRPVRREERRFGEDILRSLPNLKLLILRGYCGFDLPKLEADKRKLDLKNLKILELCKFYKDEFNEFDYENWKRYLGELRYWPDPLDFRFDQLLRYRIPLDLFKENFFRISELLVCEVDDQQLLIDFLRKTNVVTLHLGYDCNLGQSFFDEIADSVTLDVLQIFDNVWARFSDCSVLSRLNMLTFDLNFQRFRPDALAVLNNPACSSYGFYLYDGLSDMGSDARMEPNSLFHCFHHIWRVRSWQGDDDEFYCRSCGFYSSKQPGRLEEGSIETTIKHVWSKKTPSK